MHSFIDLLITCKEYRGAFSKKHCFMKIAYKINHNNYALKLKLQQNCLILIKNKK